MMLSTRTFGVLATALLIALPQAAFGHGLVSLRSPSKGLERKLKGISGTSESTTTTNLIIPGVTPATPKLSFSSSDTDESGFSLGLGGGTTTNLGSSSAALRAPGTLATSSSSRVQGSAWDWFTLGGPSFATASANNAAATLREPLEGVDIAATNVNQRSRTEGPSAAAGTTVSQTASTDVVPNLSATTAAVTATAGRFSVTGNTAGQATAARTGTTATTAASVTQTQIPWLQFLFG